MTRLEKVLYATGLAYILAETYDTYPLTNEEADNIAKITAHEYQVANFDSVTKEEADRIKDNLVLQLSSLTKELLSEEE